MLLFFPPCGRAAELIGAEPGGGGSVAGRNCLLPITEAVCSAFKVCFQEQHAECLAHPRLIPNQEVSQGHTFCVGVSPAGGSLSDDRQFRPSLALTGHSDNQQSWPSVCSLPLKLDLSGSFCVCIWLRVWPGTSQRYWVWPL